MANTNQFDLLVDDDNDDPAKLIEKLPPPAKKLPAQAAAKLPSKPLPPAEAVREGRTDVQRGGGRTGGHGTGRGRGGRFSRDSADNGNSLSNKRFSGGYKQLEEGDREKFFERRGYGGPRGDSRGGCRGDFSNGEVADGERPRRVFERHSGIGWGYENVKRDGGQGNWGTPVDDLTLETEEKVDSVEKTVDAEKQGQESVEDASKENLMAKQEEEPENKEMTLEEYEKVLEEKRKALLALESQERKVDLDKDFESMQLLSSKKNDEEIFVKLDKRKETTEKEEKARKALSINEFLKPAEGGKGTNQGPNGRGRGRGRGPREGYTGFGGRNMNNIPAPQNWRFSAFSNLGCKVKFLLSCLAILWVFSFQDSRRISFVY